MEFNGIPNNLGAIPELNKGVSKLYANLKNDMQKNGGSIRGGFESAFTSSDGLVTVTLSSEGAAAYGGSLGDVAIHLKVLTRSDLGPNAATSENNGMSGVIHNIDDVTANEEDMKRDMVKTVFIDNRSMGPEPIAPPSQTLDDKAAQMMAAASDKSLPTQTQEKAVASSRSAVDMLKARSEDGARLADRLKKSLDALKGNHPEGASKVSNPQPTETKGAEIFKAVNLKI